MEDKNPINIDSFIDYETEYKSIIKGAKITGQNLVGRCPFHDDKKSSFSANLKTGQCHCFVGCIDGNFLTFLGKYKQISTKEAYKQLLEKYGRLEKTEKVKKTKSSNRKSYTLEEYTLLKRLPRDSLVSWGVETAKDADGTSYLKIPYYKEEDIGKKNPSSIFRKRYAEKEFRWSSGSAGQLTLYGEWQLPEIRKQGWVILVEGESDAQTLWFLTFTALGVPGANNFQARMVSKLQGLKLYLHQEPDRGGQTFFDKICRILKEEEFFGEVYTFSCSQFGVKDPSELYLKEGKEKAAEKIQKAIQDAKKVDLSHPLEAIPEGIKGAPIRLRQPEGWSYSEKGICHLDEKKMIPVLICRTPILLTRRLKSLETGEEKIEIGFQRDGIWKRAIFLRSIIFTARNLPVLADLGCTITSENAKQVVRFLEALEAENIDVIPKVESASTFGWQPKGRFLPGYGEDIVLDIEPSLRGWAAAYHSSGTMEDWKQMIQPHRSRDKFRFILAASFAAPLLKIIQQRIFLVYNWGGSKGGKTAALKAALSVWGDPERLMVNFNATQVALERMAGFYNDLPLGIDERQLAGEKQEWLEKIIYMIASGTGRVRANKAGGLQPLPTWRTIALTTGEEPFNTSTTQTGVNTRVLEIYGGPFEDEASASLMHRQVALCYGWAGFEWIAHLLLTEESSIVKQYEKMVTCITENGVSGAHLAGIAAVALADAMVDTWIFKKEAEQKEENRKKILEIEQASWERAVRMARTIIQEQLSAGVADVNENATQFLVDWILSNRSQFGEQEVGTCLGLFDDDQNKVYIYPSLFNQALEKAGYSPRKTLKYLAEKQFVASTSRSGGGKSYSVTKWFNGKVSRFVEFDLEKFTKSISALDTCEKEKGEAEEGQWEQINVDENIPFDNEGETALPY